MPRLGSRWPWSLAALALAVRLGAIVLLLSLGARPQFDEYGYAERAREWRGVAADLVHDRPVSAAHWRGAYDGGVQPPLHPLLLATTGGGGAGRALSAVWSALTVLLLWSVTRRLAGRRAAIFAAATFAVFPSFVFYGSSLWSEPLFLLLLMAAVERTLAAREATGAARVRRAAAAGAMLGLALLTRAAALPLLAALPLALLGPQRCWPGRRLAAGALLAVAVATTAPWEAVLWAQEGRPVLLATGTDLDLALGNNPFIGGGRGSTWLGEADRERLQTDVARFADAHGRDARGAGIAYALDRMRRDPAAAVRRVLDRLRILSTADVFPLRHLVHAIVRPQPLAFVAGFWAVTFALHLALLALILRGLVLPDAVKHRRLLLLLAGALAVGPALTIAVTRLAVPILVVLLPIAGAGWARRDAALSWRRRLGLYALLGGAVWSATTGLAPVIESQLMPSAWSEPVVAPAARLVGASPVFGDQIAVICRDAPGAARPDSLRVFPAPDDSLTVSLARPSVHETILHAAGPWTCEKLVLQPLPGETRIVLDPVRPELWWRDQDLAPLGMPGVFLRWQGGAPAHDLVSSAHGGGR